MNWTLLLDYLRALVWPALAVVLAVVFRRSLGALVSRVRKAGAAGVEVEFDQAEDVLRRADEALEAGQQALSNSSTSDDHAADDGSADIEDSWDPQGTAESRDRLNEKARRSAIEKVLVEGVRLGWEYAKYGEGTPRFDVIWDESGFPQIRSTGEDAATRVLVSRTYKDAVFSAISHTVAASTDRLTRASGGEGCDFIFDSDGGGLTWVVVEPSLTSADRLHRVHESFSWRVRFQRKDSKRLLGVVFICRNRPADRMQKILNMLWTGDQSDMVKLIRWVDASDNIELTSTFHAIDDSIPPF